MEDWGCLGMNAGWARSRTSEAESHSALRRTSPASGPDSVPGTGVAGGLNNLAALLAEHGLCDEGRWCVNA